MLVMVMELVTIVVMPIKVIARMMAPTYVFCTWGIRIHILC